MKRLLTEIRITLRRARRLMVFRRVPKGAAGVSPSALLVLGSLWIAVTIAVNALWAGTALTFNEFGFAAALAEWTIFAMAVGLFSSRATGIPLSRAVADSASLTTIYSAFLLALATSSVILTNWFGTEHLLLKKIWPLLTGLIFLWLLISLWRAGLRLWKEPVRLAGLRFLGAALLPVFLIPSQPIVYGSNTDWSRHDIWYLIDSYRFTQDEEANTEEAASREPDIDFESVLYQQPALVEAAVKGMLPSTPDHPQIYFVGVAASDAQDVFKKEVLGAQAVFDQRFGTNGRSTVLINSTATANKIPLASATNLAAILDRVGERMDRDKDVLALFITTHGAKGRLSVSFPGISLNQFTPDSLSQALAKARIKHKVIIISACHSGSFIPAFQDSNTLIMTAAHADKTSFGCSNEREWTYFGDALFNHALKSTRSLPKAFALASDLIKEWETSQKLTASDPQISAGSSIIHVLENIGNVEERHRGQMLGAQH
jgi:Peptidase C13 family